LTWCEKYGKDIIVSGLDGDFKRQPFGKILDLIPYANSVTKLNAFCSRCADGTLAQFTWRLSGEKDQIVIGSTNYIAICRKHYNELSVKTE
jgi:thymidine kinase